MLARRTATMRISEDGSESKQHFLIVLYNKCKVAMQHMHVHHIYLALDLGAYGHTWGTPCSLFCCIGLTLSGSFAAQ